MSSPYAALKIKDFRLFLAGRLFVTVAVQIQAVAVGWQVYALTKDPLSLGMIGLSEAFPAISISLYAGHINDIFDRRRVAIFAVAALFLSFFLLAIISSQLVASPFLLWAIYAINIIIGLARGFYVPAVFAMLSEIIPRELYGNAMAWNTTSWQMSAVGAPCLGGFLYVWFNAQYTYLFAAFLLLMSFIVFYLCESRTSHIPKEEIGALDNIKEGLNFVLTNQLMLGAMALDLFAVLFGGAVALLPIFTSEVFHCGPQMLGVLRAMPSVGALLTASVLTHRPLAKHAGLVLLTAVAGYGFCMILFGVSKSLYFSLLVLAVSGALDGVSIWIRNTIFQLITPPNMKGRMAAVNNICLQSANEIGEFESGVAAKLMGLVPSVVFGGCMTLLVVLVTAFKAPKLRKLHLHHLYKL